MIARLRRKRNEILLVTAVGGSLYPGLFSPDANVEDNKSTSTEQMHGMCYEPTPDAPLA